MSNRGPMFGLLTILAIFLIKETMFIVPESHQAMRLFFGKPIWEPITEAGLYFKIPFLHSVRKQDRRILNWDGEVKEIPTRGKKFIEVDTTARWHIVDLPLFLKNGKEERIVQQRLGRAIQSATFDEISSYSLVEAVRNSNEVLDEAARKTAEREEVLQAGEESKLIELELEDITGEIERIEVGREKISRRIIEKAQKKVEAFEMGIDLIDVQLRSVTYGPEVQEKVYERMISERERIKEKILSFGKGEKAKIEGTTDKELKEIQSEAYKKVQTIEGDAEAEAIAIYADAVGRDIDFYEFLRTIDTYKNGLRDDTQLILSSKSQFMKLLQEGSASPTP